ncbi:hypothetical protein AYY17_14210 [Morganella psychrotolerans]|uniref:Uncharacterized protein n=1 Tax=Morganella psychrotolerans TaxID=368603 RepID=A0A1B8HN26_9GAMM|nr:hypothetical protein AYY17_14210 [Morganella psychrotolerans]
MLNRKEKDILKKTMKTPLYRSIKFSIVGNIQAVSFIIFISIIFLYSEDLNLPLLYKITFGFIMTLFVYLFSGWYSFRSITLANKLMLIYIKIKIKKITPP